MPVIGQPAMASGFELCWRKPTKLAAVALANKTARIVWAVTMRGESYRATEVFEQPA
jgi:hypothetical protein